MVFLNHLDGLRDCGVIFKFKRLSHLSDRSLGLSSFIGIGYLSLVFSLRVDVYPEMVIWKRLLDVPKECSPK